MNTNRFDAYEIDACIDIGDGTVEALKGKVQDGCFFTVYGRRPEGRVEALRDFPELNSAVEWTNKIRGNKPVYNWVK